MSSTVGQANPIAPSDQFTVVVASDLVGLSYHGTKANCRAIWVGVTGNVAITDDQGSTVTIPNVAPGMMHPIVTGKILSTGTTATSIIAFF